MSTFSTSRVFAATPEDVFAAFAAPELLARWWGPDGFHNTFDVFEFRAGGQWRFTMHGPDGTHFPNEATFVAIEPARRLVIKHQSMPHFTLTITLESSAAGTLVSWNQSFDSPDVAAALKQIVVPANEQNLSRWQSAVESLKSGRA